jgi:hypothetical protein
MGIRCIDHATPSILKKLAVPLPTSGGLSVGIVLSWTKATEFVLFLFIFVVKEAKVPEDPKNEGVA